MAEAAAAAAAAAAAVPDPSSSKSPEAAAAAAAAAAAVPDPSSSKSKVPDPPRPWTPLVQPVSSTPVLPVPDPSSSKAEVPAPETVTSLVAVPEPPQPREYAKQVLARCDEHEQSHIVAFFNDNDAIMGDEGQHRKRACADMTGPAKETLTKKSDTLPPKKKAAVSSLLTASAQVNGLDPEEQQRVFKQQAADYELGKALCLEDDDDLWVHNFPADDEQIEQIDYYKDDSK